MGRAINRRSHRSAVRLTTQVHRRADGSPLRVRFPWTKDCGQHLNLQHIRSAGGRPACLVAGPGDDQKDGLPNVVNKLCCQCGIVLRKRTDIVDAGNIVSDENRYDPGHPLKCLEIDTQQTPMGNRRKSDGRMQSPRQLRQIIQIGRATRDMQMGRFMRQ